MLPLKRTFEPEKRQLQELNCRLAQYLNRTKQLERDNTDLQREISVLRQSGAGAQRDPGYKAELRELRRTVGQLQAERSQAEMERERLWRELQTARSLCSEQTGVCQDITGRLRGREHELDSALKTNGELQQRLHRLETDRGRLEEAHRRELEALRRQVEVRTAPPLLRPIPPSCEAVSVEDVQEFAFGLSEGWVKTFDMYQQKVEEMERSIREDQARLRDTERDKVAYAQELDRIHTEAERQSQAQARLEQELAHMHQKFQMDCGEYEMIIDELQRERQMMVQSMEQKMVEHEQLLKHKMDLGLELAAYRALLEGERINLDEAQRRQNRPQRERIIEIKTPPQPYPPRASSALRPPSFRSSVASSSYRPPPVPRPTSGALSPSRVIPISVSRHQSPAARRDMVSFSKAKAAQSTSSPTVSAIKDKQPEAKRGVKAAHISNQSPKVQSHEATQERSQMPSKNYTSKTRHEESAFDGNLTNGRSEEQSGKTVLDTVSVEEIIEKVIRPAGLEAKASDDSKVRYHIQKIQQEDGTTKTQIVLESKVEEQLDISEDSDLEELLHQGVKKVSLEDLKDTATEIMIKNLLSGVKGGEDLANKSINVEIIEEPVEALSDNEEMEIKRLQTGFQKRSGASYFQIEELENAPMKATSQQWREGLGQVEEVSRESDSSFVSQEKESREYFVSTPDDFSESEEGCGITSYGHYGIVDDLSDERYYQDELLPPRATPEESIEYKYVTSDRPSFKEGFPECIMEEEVRVSPIVQESVLEFLREDSLEPKDQLTGALEKLQESVSGPLKEELAYLAKISRESPDKVAVGVRKMEQSSDDGTMTIVAELNVSQTLEESGLLDESGDLSEEHIMAALRGAGLEKALQGGGGGGYSFRVSTGDDEDEDGGFGDISEKDIMERFMRAETSYSHHHRDGPEEGSAGATETVKEQRIVYLESPTED